MTEIMEIYKCSVCGNTVEVLFNGYGQLICCGQNMIHLEEQTSDDELLSEKHVPVIKRTEDGIVIKVGSVLHPMLHEHYIKCTKAMAYDFS